MGKNRLVNSVASNNQTFTYKRRVCDALILRFIILEVAKLSYNITIVIVLLQCTQVYRIGLLILQSPGEFRTNEDKIIMKEDNLFKRFKK